MNKVLLIAGHGAGDVGATAANNGKDWKEAIETRNIAKRVQEYCKGRLDVALYPMERNAYYDYRDKSLVGRACFQDYDYCLELHLNAFKADKHGDGNQMGTEIIVTPSALDRSVADRILSNLVGVGFRRRPVKVRSDLGVLNTASKLVNTSLLEVCFIDDADDMRHYMLNYDSVVAAISNALLERYGQEVTPLDNTPADWSKEAVEWAQNVGLLAGDADGNLRLRDNITREETVALLHRFYKLFVK